eukprot:scaffold20791_cov137-Cylindrotheca_fusiformis.AAC.4
MKRIIVTLYLHEMHRDRRVCLLGLVKETCSGQRTDKTDKTDKVDYQPPPVDFKITLDLSAMLRIFLIRMILSKGKPGSSFPGPNLLFPTFCLLGFLSSASSFLTTDSIVCRSSLRTFCQSGTNNWSNANDHSAWKLDNDFDFFLNQCAIQSLLVLMTSLRDRQSALWLENFTQPIVRERTTQKTGRDQVLGAMAKALDDATPQAEKEVKLLKYHGVGAINTTLFPTWDSYFEKLLDEPDITYYVESNRPQVPDYELEIKPASVCSRLISVREQIAREFARDLDSIIDISKSFIHDYFEHKGKKETDQEGYRTNLLFLDAIVDDDYLPSPLRKGNFDLLILLVTQESIHRVLNSEDDTVDRSSFRFLRNYYAERIGSHFSGNNWYGRADEFLDELISTSPCVSQLQDEECDLVDPVRVAEYILRARERVALEWLEVALDAPNAHLEIKRLQLQRLMGNGEHSQSP